MLTLYAATHQFINLGKKAWKYIKLTNPKLIYCHLVMGRKKKLNSARTPTKKISKPLEGSLGHDLLLVGPTVLELHGLKKSKRLEYVALGGQGIAKSLGECWNSRYSEKDLWEMNTPRNTVTVRGFRFQSLKSYVEIEGRRRSTTAENWNYSLASGNLDTHGSSRANLFAVFAIRLRHFLFISKTILTSIAVRVFLILPPTFRSIWTKTSERPN